MSEYFQHLFFVYQNYTGIFWGALPTMVIFWLAITFVNKQHKLEVGSDYAAKFTEFDDIKRVSLGEIPGADFDDPVELFLFTLGAGIMWPFGLVVASLSILVGIIILFRGKIVYLRKLIRNKRLRLLS
jgi:hypothetical protein